MNSLLLDVLHRQKSGCCVSYAEIEKGRITAIPQSLVQVTGNSELHGFIYRKVDPNHHHRITLSLVVEHTPPEREVMHSNPQFYSAFLSLLFARDYYIAFCP